MSYNNMIVAEDSQAVVKHTKNISIPNGGKEIFKRN